MRRLIRNSTAIVTALAVLAPHASLAEMRISAEQAAEQGPVNAKNNPELYMLLQGELAAGLTLDQLTCATGDERPCADDVFLMTPQGIKVVLSEENEVILAPADSQNQRLAGDEEAVQANAEPVGADTEIIETASDTPPIEKPDPSPEAEDARDQNPSETQVEALAANLLSTDKDKDVQEDTEKVKKEAEKAEKKAEKAAKKEAKEEKKAEKAARKAVAKAETSDASPPKAKESAKKEKAEEPSPPRSAKVKAEQDQADADALAAKLKKKADKASKEAAKKSAEAKQVSDAPPPKAEKKSAKADDSSAKPQKKAEEKADTTKKAKAEKAPRQSSNLILSDTLAATRRAGGQKAMAQRLEEEIAAGLRAKDLTCETGTPLPCDKGVALLTPRGVTVETDAENRLMLVREYRQKNRISSDGKLQLRAPEEGNVKTAAAKEAATETAAPKAAALNDNAKASEVPLVEEKVTKENTRSSSEDFETNLRNALNSAGLSTQTNETKSANKDDSGSDLAKALILGLGAVAVGQMLNNNRQVALSAPDRVVVTRSDGSQEVVKDEVALLRQPGSTVTTENFDDGSSRTIVTRPDGSKVVTIRDSDLRVLRRTLLSADGKTTQLIDDTTSVEPVNVQDLPPPAPVVARNGALSEDDLRTALQSEAEIGRRFTLGQIRAIPEVRALVAPVNIDAITFDTGSAAIKPNQAQQLATLGRVIEEAVSKNPQEIFMIEGYTDTVGTDAANLALSDRRAESVALALTEYFDVPPENLIIQGYGERFLQVRAEGDIRQNRRASVRRITDLLQTASN